MDDGLPNATGMDKRHQVLLSGFCWDCLHGLEDVFYATAYTHLTVTHAEYLRDGFRAAHPDATTDLHRFVVQGQEVGLSVCSDAIRHFAPQMLEFSATWAAVKSLGLYEVYLGAIGAHALQTMPAKVKMLARVNTAKPVKDWICRRELGRGIDLFVRLFGYDPPETYRPSLGFFFELRNVAIHRDRIADGRLQEAASRIGQTIRTGTPVKWSLSLALQLHQLLVEYLVGADRSAAAALGLELQRHRPHWFTDDAGAETSVEQSRVFSAPPSPEA